jgi:hypothetical protein
MLDDSGQRNPSSELYRFKRVSDCLLSDACLLLRLKSFFEYPR